MIVDFFFHELIFVVAAAMDINMSPKVANSKKFEEGISFAHKMKTKRIWKDKESPKNQRYNKTPDRLEPSLVIHF